MAVSLSRQLGLLQRSRAFRLLFFATLGSGIGTWLAAIALTVDVFDRTGSGAWVSALLIADFVPGIVIGLLFGSLIDRLPRRRLMVAADVVRLGVFCYLPFAGSAGAIVAAAAVVGLANAFFVPAVWAGMPNLVDDSELPFANSLFQTTDNLTWAIGPLVGGSLVAVASPDLAYWINAATFLASAVLISRVPARALQSEQAFSRGHLTDLADGFRAVVRSRALLAVLVAWTIWSFGGAAINVGEVILAKVTFSSGAFGFGFLAACSGVGLVLGSVLVAPLLERRGVGAVYAPTIALQAVGFAAAAVSPNVWLAGACVAVAGLGNGASVVCNGLLVQRGAPDHLRGRVFTLIMSVNSAARGIGMACAGLAVDALGPRWLWGGAALAFALAALSGGLLVPGGRPAGLPARPEKATL